MPRTAKADNVVTLYTDREAVLIARALHEAADRHVNGYNPEFHEDADVGREMIALMQARFPDARGAFARAETMRQAITLGFLPPPDGNAMSAAETFLAQHRATQDAAKAAVRGKLRTPCHQPDLDDIPF